MNRRDLQTTTMMVLVVVADLDVVVFHQTRFLNKSEWGHFRLVQEDSSKFPLIPRKFD